VLWARHMELVRVEVALQTLTSVPDPRTIQQQIEQRVEAHLFIAFPAHGPTMTLRMKLKRLVTGLTPREVLKSLATILMVDVHFPTTDGRTLGMPRYTEPDTEQQMLLNSLRLTLPSQPPPRIRNGTAVLPTQHPNP